MKASRLTTVLENLLDQPWAAFIWGAPGIGKSSIVRQIAERRRMPLIDIRASLLDPTDLRGIPMIQDGTAVWCPPSFLPKKSDKPGILFLDEINAAPPLVPRSISSFSTAGSANTNFPKAGASLRQAIAARTRR